MNPQSPYFVRKVMIFLKPEEITVDETIQSRVAIDKNIVAEYVEAMEEGEEFPPGVVFYDAALEHYYLAEGFHRYFAQLRAKPNDPIRVEQKLGTRADALWHSIASNRSHGLRRSNADKIKAIELALTHENGREMSNKQIAAYVGVTDGTVAKVRKRLEGDGRLEKTMLRKGRDGRMISTARIGEKSAPKETSDQGSRIRRKTSEYVEVPLSRSDVGLAAVEIRHFFGDAYAVALGKALLKLVTESQE